MFCTTYRPLKLGVVFQVKDIKEVDTEKRRLTMEALLSMTWVDPRAKCRKQVLILFGHSLIESEPRNLHV